MAEWDFGTNEAALRWTPPSDVTEADGRRVVEKFDHMYGVLPTTTMLIDWMRQMQITSPVELLACCALDMFALKPCVAETPQCTDDQQVVKVASFEKTPIPKDISKSTNPPSFVSLFFDF